MRYGVRCGHERSAIRSNGWLQAARAAPFLSGRQGRPARCVRRLALIWRRFSDFGSRRKDDPSCRRRCEERFILIAHMEVRPLFSGAWVQEGFQSRAFFWKDRAGSCGLPPLFRCLPRFRVNPHWRTKVLPIRRSRPEMRPARKGALAVGERMAQLYGLTCARPGRARRIAEWAFTQKDRISTNVSRETSIAHLCWGFVFLHRASLSVIAGLLASRWRLARTFPLRWRQERAREAKGSCRRSASCCDLNVISYRYW